MDYDNIVSCCDKREDDSTCSHHKGNEYDERLFVSPLNEECESHFQYAPNGQVFSSSKEGQYTIDLLNLNSYKLQRARAAHIKNCKAYNNPELVMNLFIKPDEDDNVKRIRAEKKKKFLVFT